MIEAEVRRQREENDEGFNRLFDGCWSVFKTVFYTLIAIAGGILIYALIKILS